MALEKMVSDLSNFKTKGDVAYDKLDPQINNGVDYFPDDTSGAKGFTPNTDLLTKYNKFMKDVKQNKTLPNQYVGQANILAPNAGLRVNDNKTRSAYGSEGEYLESAGVGMSSTNHILSSDNVLGVRIQPKFTSEFMTTPIADFVSKFQIPYDSDVYDVQQHISSGPTQFNIKPFDNTPSVPNAHGGDFMTTPIASYNSRFSLSTPLGAGSRTLLVRKEAFRQSSEAGAANIDRFTKPFSVDTLKSTYNDSSYIDDLLKFDKKGKNTYPNVPSGINDEGNFGTANFRKVASKGPFSGNDNQPFILRGIGNKWGIDANDGLLQTLDQVAGGFVRGAPGITGLVDRSLQDKVRIMRFMFTTNLGLTFITKQFALQALNPTLESKIWNPASALSLTGIGQIISGFVSAAQGGGGLPNTSQLLQAARSAAISAAFPIGHPERHLGGLKYQDVNPLGEITDDNPDGIGAKVKSIPVIGNLLFNKINEKIRDVGGFSRLGAQANMKFSLPGDRTTQLELKDRLLLMNPNKYLFPISSAPMKVVNGVPSFTIEAGSGDGSAAKADADKATQKYKVGQTQGGVTFNKQAAMSREDDDGIIKRHSTLAYDFLTDANAYFKPGGAGDFASVGPETFPEEKKREDLKTAQKIGNPYTRETINEVETFESSSKFMTIKGNNQSSNVDKINMLPYGLDYNQTEDAELKDFIKFRFRDIVNNKFIIFRAILEGITDTVTPEYSEDNYIGRPDKVYVYQGADRDIAFTFSIYPKTKQELPVLVKKLNHLVGLCYPTFSETERMQTPFMELTMGDMYNGAPGVLRGLTITVEEQTTWEIDDGLQFPHFIKAACEFRLIGNHVPDARGKHYDLPSINDIQRV